ncbi:MAG: HzsA-related protein [Planctomycetota bacterium]|jgi:cytochrome c553
MKIMIPHGFAKRDLLTIALVLIGAIPCLSQARSNLSKLDAPLLFVKRHSYQGIHIYDTYYQWWPGGGIYVLENPDGTSEQQKIRAVIDATTPETLGEGVYSDPELSYDATSLLFCFKGQPEGNTCIYEIGIDGTGLRELTNPIGCVKSSGRYTSHHDVGPAYLPDGRIIFTSTRLNGLVPCNNTGVDIMHVMNADGSNMHAISVNNVNEFDPCVLPDGRILYGRWEYVDKTALTQQTLWTIFPDGSNETAFYANNLVRPEAFLDARPVPGYSHLVVSSLTRHNSTPRGSIGIIDVFVGKNDPAAITNLDYPDEPTNDLGDSCEPWPLSKDVVLMSARPSGFKRNAIVLADRSGKREVVYSEPNICCHSPMLVKVRPKPPVLQKQINPDMQTGRFFLQDIYKGLAGVKRGEVKWLRVIEETSRASGTHGAAYNQTFLLSAALAFSVKNYLGVVPVEPDGSAYFEVPSGRAIYLQALDAEGRMIQSMRTFVQASPGVTRSCIGCHENKFTTAGNVTDFPPTLKRAPSKLRPESWGSGFVDYPSMVQPILDKRCVSCHGGADGIAAGLDLSGGWTEHFNISYENLVNRRNNQLTANLIAGIDCMNGTARWSAQIFKPRSHGSGAAPLAELLVSSHEGRIKDLTRTERDLILAWIDTNGLYYGTWDYTENNCQLKAYLDVKNALIKQMQSAKCMSCHENHGKFVFESDWINLKQPEMSRILRGPLAKGEEGWGLENCRNRKVAPGRQRIRMYYTGGYVHHVLPLDSFKPKEYIPPETSGEPLITFSSIEDSRYQTILKIIRRGCREALAAPRVDMPGAKITAGLCKKIMPVPAPDVAPQLKAGTHKDGIVQLSWERSAPAIGLTFDLYRHDKPNFMPKKEYLINTTRLFHYEDLQAKEGKQYYALIASSGSNRSRQTYAMACVPKSIPVPAPKAMTAVSLPGLVKLQWTETQDLTIRFNVYRAPVGSNNFEKLNDKPLPIAEYSDVSLEANVSYRYVVRCINRRGIVSPPSREVICRAMPEPKKPVAMETVH